MQLKNIFIYICTVESISMKNNSIFVLELFGIADKYTIKGKQLFIPCANVETSFGRV